MTFFRQKKGGIFWVGGGCNNDIRIDEKLGILTIFDEICTIFEDF